MKSKSGNLLVANANQAPFFLVRHVAAARW